MNIDLELLIVAGIGFVVTTLVVSFLARTLRGLGRFDVPNARSSHKVPTPRGAGVGLAVGFGTSLGFATFLFGFSAPDETILVGAAMLAAMGAADDWSHGLKRTVRFAAQSVAALLVLWSLGPLPKFPLPSPLDFELGTAAYPISLLWIVGVANIYNFLDGIDGLAGVQGAVAGFALLVFPIDGPFTAAGAALLGASLGFLSHNWHPAKIFMGDSGSVATGFFLGAIPFSAGGSTQNAAVFLMALVLWFFLSDGAFTLIRRLYKQDRFWEAHRTHLYQRLVGTGLRHDQVALRVGLASLALAVCAVAGYRAFGASAGWPLLALALGSFAGYVVWTQIRESSASGRPAPYRTPAVDANPEVKG